MLIIASGITASQAQTTWAAEYPEVIVRAEAILELKTQRAGIIRKCKVALGSDVTPGTIVATLDSAETELLKQQAELQLLKSEAQLNRTKALLAQAKSAADYRKRDLTRHKKAADSLGESALERLEEASHQAEIAHVIAYQDWVQAAREFDIHKLQKTQAELEHEKTLIQCPSAGVVDSLDVSAGMFVEAGKRIATVYVLERMHCTISLPESETELSSLIDRPVVVSCLVDNKLVKLAGRVQGHAHEVDAFGNVQLNIVIENQKVGQRWLLLHGKSVALKIQTPKMNSQMPVASR